MSFDIGGLAQQTAGQVIGAGMGLALEKHNDKRQLRQQQKLQDMQISGNRNLAQFNKDLQLEMWKETNYPAQMAMLKEAGLNPALMYGNAGAGGTTAGGGGGGVSGAQAPSGGGETLAMMQQGAQMALMRAQTENIQASTEKTKIEAAKTAGVDTELAKTQITSLAQGVENQKAVERLTQIEGDIAEVEREIKGTTIKAGKYLITGEAERLLQQVNILKNEGLISENTWSEKIEIVRADLIGLQLNNILTGAKTVNINQDTRLKQAQTATEGERRFLTKEQARAIGQQIMQGWDGLNNEQKRQRLQEKLQNYTQNEGQMFDIMEQAVDGIMRAGMSNQPRSTTTWESGENEKQGSWNRQTHTQTK